MKFLLLLWVLISAVLLAPRRYEKDYDEYTDKLALAVTKMWRFNVWIDEDLPIPLDYPYAEVSATISPPGTEGFYSDLSGQISWFLNHLDITMDDVLVNVAISYIGKISKAVDQHIKQDRSEEFKVVVTSLLLAAKYHLDGIVYLTVFEKATRYLSLDSLENLERQGLVLLDYNCFISEGEYAYWRLMVDTMNNERRIDRHYVNIDNESWIAERNKLPLRTIRRIDYIRTSRDLNQSCNSIALKEAVQFK
jgi:hypothetical protein